LQSRRAGTGRKKNVVVLSVLIFVAELSVVTCGTVRTIAIARGMKWLAPALGLVEVSIWLYAIGAVMKNLSEPSCYVAYALGFSLGNFLGVFLEGKLALGNLFIRVITRRDSAELIASLKSAGYGVTTVGARGATGPVQIVLTVIKRKDWERVRHIIRAFDPKVFYSVDDLQLAAEGVFPAARRRARGLLPTAMSMERAA
jgi:uncharacterized protein YebE (UPF0316 family)